MSKILQIHRHLQARNVGLLRPVGRDDVVGPHHRGRILLRPVQLFTVRRTVVNLQIYTVYPRCSSLLMKLDGNTGTGSNHRIKHVHM